jgi:hypothetical protein
MPHMPINAQLKYFFKMKILMTHGEVFMLQRLSHVSLKRKKLLWNAYKIKIYCQCTDDYVRNLLKFMPVKIIFSKLHLNSYHQKF